MANARSAAERTTDPAAERTVDGVLVSKPDAIDAENARPDRGPAPQESPSLLIPSGGEGPPGGKRSAKLSLTKRAEALIDALQLDPASGLGRTSRSYDHGHDPSEDERIMRKIRDLDLLPSGCRIRSDYWHARRSWVIEVVGPPPWHSSALSTSSRKRR